MPPHCQRVLALLLQEPPVSYAEISARLSISVGGTGPSAVAAWTSYAATRPSPPCSTPKPEASPRARTAAHGFWE